LSIYLEWWYNLDKRKNAVSSWGRGQRFSRALKITDKDKKTKTKKYRTERSKNRLAAGFSS
jgi:hypothetical protein